MPTREENMLRQVAANAFRLISFEELFVIDESLPAAVTEQIAGSADVAAALDCWRGLMHAAVDAVAEHYKTSS